MNPLTEIPGLLRQLREDTGALVREEIALAKTEVSEKLATTSRNAAYLLAGALVGSSALLLLLMACSYLLAQLFARLDWEPGTAAFAGFLIVAIIAALISSMLISKALKAFRNYPIQPKRTVQSLHENRQWAQSKLS